MVSRPNLIVSILALIVVGAFFYLAASRKAPALTAVTWAGPYGRAQASALFLTYAERTRIDLRIAQYDGGLTELRNRVASRRFGWDVIDLELPDAVAACREGLLEQIDPKTLPDGLNGIPASADFVPNAIGPCWVGSMVYSRVVAFAPHSFGATRPRSLPDFFDLTRFPGIRALWRGSAKYNLELALLADGAAPRDVYRLLSTPQGADRALAKLQTIRASIIWCDDAAEPSQMLRGGRAAFATVLNGDVYDAATHGHPLGVIWDHQLYELDVFAVPKDDQKRQQALDFIRFATAAPALGRVANWVPYGPARRSANPLVARNPELGIEMKPFLPTTPPNFVTAFAVDDAWWLKHGAEIAPRWRTWLQR